MWKCPICNLKHTKPGMHIKHMQENHIEWYNENVKKWIQIDKKI